MHRVTERIGGASRAFTVLIRFGVFPAEPPLTKKVARVTATRELWSVFRFECSAGARRGAKGSFVLDDASKQRNGASGEGRRPRPSKWRCLGRDVRGPKAQEINLSTRCIYLILSYLLSRSLFLIT
jgi:hypothetical protein